MTAFVKFPSLENHYQEGFITRLTDMGLADQSFLVTEKVHGANFSLHATKDGVKPARRTDFLAEGEKFFNYKPVFEKYKAGATMLREYFDAETVVVYGELFGGNVASGMAYQLDQDFLAFDLVVDGKPVNKLIARDLLLRYGFRIVPAIGVYSSLQQALAVDQNFTSALVREGFTGNVEATKAEGLVIEPIIPTMYNEDKRVYFKKKTARFLEEGGNKLPKPVEELPEHVVLAIQEAGVYFTEARYANVVSKVGEVSIKDIGMLTGLFAQDVIEDMKRAGLDVPEDSVFGKYLGKAVINFLRPLLLQKKF